MRSRKLIILKYNYENLINIEFATKEKVDE